MSIVQTIKQSKKLYLLLGVSLLFFFIKGISYALIGSFVPITFTAVITLLLYSTQAVSLKAHRRAIRFWAVLIVFWALIRIGLSLMLLFNSTLTESHLREQFGLIEQLISIGLLCLGIGVFKALRS